MALAAPGDLDPTFHGDGKVVTNLGVPYRGSAVALQADGKIVVAGSTGAAPERNFTLARFNGDGTLDASFGTGGVVTTDLGEDDTAADVIVQADGKIVVAGGSGRLALARYLSNGSLDPTFGSSGTVTTNLPEGGHGRAVALQADGKIVVVGYTTGIISPAFVLARYGENGSLDPTFGSSGVAVTDCAGISSDVAIQADGKIVVAGYDANGGTFSFILARYQPEGGPDLAFDGDGVADTEVGTGWADYSDTAVAIQPDGKIVAAGGGYTGFSLARYESNGSLDPAFGVDGIVITDSGPFGWSWCTDLFIEPNGRIVAGGPVGLLSQFDFGLARYLHTGELDSGFGSGGTVVTDLGDNESGSVGIALQADGKLVAAGASGSSLALARYLGADGAEMYYAQLPDPNGWDVRYPGGWSILGDDWQADQTGPVNEIRLWLSWREDNTSSLGQVGIGIWSDQPGSPAKPGQVLWNKTFNPGDYVLTLYGSGDQGFYDPSLTSPIVLPHDHWNYHEVTIPNIPDPFVQQEGEIYWLVTFVYPDMAWHGWKTTEGSFLASAVQRVSGDWSPLTDPLSGKALDLSFVIGSDAVPACPATIRAIRSGNWSDANIWDLQRVPGHNDLVQIGSGHTVVVPDQVQIRGLCNYGSLQSWGNHRLSILASGSVANYGEILGSAGRAGGGTECGQAGSSIEIEGSPIYNEGTIRAGAGGTGDQCGGPGGSTMVLGRNTTNEGTICGGKGGDAVGTTANAQGGAGGETHVWGKWGGAGALINHGLACGGDGGAGHFAATGPQRGGSGGRLKLISLPSVYLEGGQHYGGRGGQGSGGGSDGRDGSVVIEPSMISVAGSGTEVWGGDVLIFGGNDWVLDLSALDGAAISATHNISLAVGAGGIVDLRGNTDQVLHAANQVIIAADTILTDPGVGLSEVAGGNVITQTGQILNDFSLLGPDQTAGPPGVTIPLPLTLLNSGPVTDTYSLGWTDSGGWGLSTLPPSITVQELDSAALTPTLTIPSTTSFGDTDWVTVTATSLNNPALVEIKQTRIRVAAATYLPLIVRSAGIQ